MTAVVCIVSLFSATLFPQSTAAGTQHVESGPLVDGREFRTSLPLQVALTLSDVDFFVIWAPEDKVPMKMPVIEAPIEALVVEMPALEAPKMEMPGTPPDAEPIPSHPTPNQPDGPAIPPPRNTAPPPPPPPSPTDGTLRERALNRLAEHGAVQWQLDVFDCIGWYESGWQNKRSPTGDDGVFQINDVHDPELRRRGLDPYAPEDAADYAWSLSLSGTTFKPWNVRAKCGV